MASAAAVRINQEDYGYSQNLGASRSFRTDEDGWHTKVSSNKRARGDSRRGVYNNRGQNFSRNENGRPSSGSKQTVFYSRTNNYQRERFQNNNPRKESRPDRGSGSFRGRGTGIGRGNEKAQFVQFKEPIEHFEEEVLFTPPSKDLEHEPYEVVMPKLPPQEACGFSYRDAVAKGLKHQTYLQTETSPKLNKDPFMDDLLLNVSKQNSSPEKPHDKLKSFSNIVKGEKLDEIVEDSLSKCESSTIKDIDAPTAILKTSLKVNATKDIVEQDSKPSNKKKNSASSKKDVHKSPTKKKTEAKTKGKSRKSSNSDKVQGKKLEISFGEISAFHIDNIISEYPKVELPQIVILKKPKAEKRKIQSPPTKRDCEKFLLSDNSQSKTAIDKSSVNLPNPSDNEEIVMTSSRKELASEIRVSGTITDKNLDNLTHELKEIKRGDIQNSSRGNVLCTSRGNVLCTSRGNVLCTSRGNVLCTSRDNVLSTSRDNVLSTSRDNVLSTSRDNVLSTSRDNVLSTSRDNVLSTSRDNVLSTSRDNVLSTSRDNVLSTSRDNVLSTSRDNVLSTSRDNVLSTSRDNVLSTSRDNVLSTSRDNVLSTSRDNVLSTSRDNVLSTSRDNVLSTSRDNVLSTSRDNVQKSPLSEKEKSPRDQETSLQLNSSSDLLASSDVTKASRVSILDNDKKSSPSGILDSSKDFSSTIRSSSPAQKRDKSDEELSVDACDKLQIGKVNDACLITDAIERSEFESNDRNTEKVASAYSHPNESKSESLNESLNKTPVKEEISNSGNVSDVFLSAPPSTPVEESDVPKTELDLASQVRHLMENTVNKSDVREVKSIENSNADFAVMNLSESTSIMNMKVSDDNITSITSINTSDSEPLQHSLCVDDALNSEAEIFKDIEPVDENANILKHPQSELTLNSISRDRADHFLPSVSQSWEKIQTEPKKLNSLPQRQSMQTNSRRKLDNSSKDAMFSKSAWDKNIQSTGLLGYNKEEETVPDNSVMLSSMKGGCGVWANDGSSFPQTFLVPEVERSALPPLFHRANSPLFSEAHGKSNREVAPSTLESSSKPTRNLVESAVQTTEQLNLNTMPDVIANPPPFTSAIQPTSESDTLVRSSVVGVPAVPTSTTMVPLTNYQSQSMMHNSNFSNGAPANMHVMHPHMIYQPNNEMEYNHRFSAPSQNMNVNPVGFLHQTGNLQYSNISPYDSQWQRQYQSEIQSSDWMGVPNAFATNDRNYQKQIHGIPQGYGYYKVSPQPVHPKEQLYGASNYSVPPQAPQYQMGTPYMQTLPSFIQRMPQLPSANYNQRPATNIGIPSRFSVPPPMSVQYERESSFNPQVNQTDVKGRQVGQDSYTDTGKSVTTPVSSTGRNPLITDSSYSNSVKANRQVGYHSAPQANTLGDYLPRSIEQDSYRRSNDRRQFVKRNNKNDFKDPSAYPPLNANSGSYQETSDLNNNFSSRKRTTYKAPQENAKAALKTPENKYYHDKNKGYQQYERNSPAYNPPIDSNYPLYTELDSPYYHEEKQSPYKAMNANILNTDKVELVNPGNNFENVPEFCAGGWKYYQEVVDSHEEKGTGLKVYENTYVPYPNPCNSANGSYFSPTDVRARVEWLAFKKAQTLYDSLINQNQFRMDVTVVCSKGSAVCSNSHILSTCSDYFRDRLAVMTEEYMTVFVNVPSKIMKHFLQMMSCGEAFVPIQDVHEVVMKAPIYLNLEM